MAKRIGGKRETTNDITLAVEPLSGFQQDCNVLITNFMKSLLPELNKLVRNTVEKTLKGTKVKMADDDFMEISLEELMDMVNMAPATSTASGSASGTKPRVRKEIPDNERCKYEADGKRCPFRKLAGGLYCQKHQTKIDKENEKPKRGTNRQSANVPSTSRRKRQVDDDDDDTANASDNETANTSDNTSDNEEETTKTSRASEKVTKTVRASEKVVEKTSEKASEKKATEKKTSEEKKDPRRTVRNRRDVDDDEEEKEEKEEEEKEEEDVKIKEEPKKGKQEKEVKKPSKTAPAKVDKDESDNEDDTANASDSEQEKEQEETKKPEKSVTFSSSSSASSKSSESKKKPNKDKEQETAIASDQDEDTEDSKEDDKNQDEEQDEEQDKEQDEEQTGVEVSPLWDIGGKESRYGTAKFEEKYSIIFDLDDETIIGLVDVNKKFKNDNNVLDSVLKFNEKQYKKVKSDKSLEEFKISPKACPSIAPDPDSDDEDTQTTRNRKDKRRG